MSQRAVTEVIPFNVQADLLRLKIYEPNIFRELRERLREHEKKAIQKSLDYCSKFLKSWECPNCGFPNKVSRDEISKTLHEIAKREPKIETSIETIGEKTMGAGDTKLVVSDLDVFGTAVWKGGSVKVHCANCLLMCYRIAVLGFNPIFPWKDNPKVASKFLPHYELRSLDMLYGEKALDEPKTASTDFLRKVVNFYRNRTDAVAQRKLGIALNELVIRGEKPSV